jgi:two-component system phosphate regulon sensor histidine kinase PhoR
MGALLVVHDVTRVHRLEKVRRDFVANVSHELKTPITSIRGFVETLQDGAVHDPEKAKRFLDIIRRQSERLNAIIEDLMELSRIEREAETETIDRGVHDLGPVLEAAVADCAAKASARNVGVSLRLAGPLFARVNARMLEQAVANLLDNAIKYSDPGAGVEIGAEQSGDTITIHVRDQGPGIPSEHLPRIFERFYRVDKARSREVGGTGLGLAIVKHIAQAHGGTVSVESTPGEGSLFAVHLPTA